MWGGFWVMVCSVVVVGGLCEWLRGIGEWLEWCSVSLWCRCGCPSLCGEPSL
ncbi:MAG: hypothetical protein ACTSO9_04725 [Candidatus Helarchaeota archaeon]